MKAVIGTKNNAKINGAKEALEKYFPNVEVQGIDVSSDVSEQPVNEETYIGAKKRVQNVKEYCIENNIEADLYLGIETGIENRYEKWFITNVAVVEDNQKNVSYGTSPSFPVPNKYVEKIIEKGFAEVMNDVFSRDEERSKKFGGIQLLTKGNITRIDLTELAFTMALTKHVNGDIWK